MNDIYKTLLALNGQQAQAPATTPQSMSPAIMRSFLNMPQQQRQQGPQYQQPSWLDLFNQTLMMGSMMPQQMPMNPYGYGMNAFNMPQQQPANWWQKGLQGTGALLSGLSTPAAAAGTIPGPWSPYLLGGGLAAGGIGGLLGYLGQPGTMQ